MLAAVMVSSPAERKLMERRVSEALEFNQTVISASSLGITAYTALGQCTLANDAAASTTGATREQILQQNFRHIESWKKAGLLQAAE